MKKNKIISKLFLYILAVSILLPALPTHASGKDLTISICPKYTPSYADVHSKYPDLKVKVTASYAAMSPYTETFELTPGDTTCTNGFYTTRNISMPTAATLNIRLVVTGGTDTLYDASKDYNYDQFMAIPNPLTYSPPIGVTPPSGGISPITVIGRDRYIHGNIFFENKNNPLPVKVHVYRVNSNGVQDEEIDVYSGSYSVGSGTSGIATGYSDKTGSLVTADGLPDGNYVIKVDESFEDVFSYWQTIAGDLATYSAFGATGAAMCLIIPGCAWTVGAAAGIAAGVAYIFDKITTFVQDSTQGELRVVGSQTVTITNGETSEDPVIVIATAQRISALDKALSSAIKTLAGFVGSFMKTAVEGINNLLDETANIVLGDGVTTGVESAWTKIRNIALTLLIMALIIIAFANVLQIDIEHYGLNRMIPRIIISIIMAYLSWLIVTFFFDLAKALQDQAWGLLANGKHGGGLEALRTISINFPTTGDIVAKAGSVLVLLVLLIGILICLIILWFSLLMRVVVLSFLLAVAPLAFILNIMPFTSKLYKQWWSEFFKWMFMGPIAVTIIALGSVIASSSFQFSGAVSLSGDSTSPAGAGWNMLIGLLILGASIYFAATLPQKWGGGIMKGWNKAGKNLWGKTGGAAGKAAWNQTGGRVTQPISGAWKGLTTDWDKKRQQRVDRGANTLLNGLPGKNHGMDPELYRINEEAKILNAESKLHEYKSEEDFAHALDNSSGAKQKAVLLAAAKAGMVPSSHEKLLVDIANADKTGLIEDASRKDNLKAFMQYGDSDSANRAYWDTVKAYGERKDGDISAAAGFLSGTLRTDEIGVDEAIIGKSTGLINGITEENMNKLGETKGAGYQKALRGLKEASAGPGRSQAGVVAQKKAMDDINKELGENKDPIGTLQAEAEEENVVRDGSQQTTQANDGRIQDTNVAQNSAESEQQERNNMDEIRRRSGRS